MIRNWRSGGVVQRAALMHPPIFSPHFEEKKKKKALKWLVQLISSVYSWLLLTEGSTAAVRWFTFDMFTVWRGWGVWGVEVGGSQEWKDVKCAQPPAEWKRKQDICFKGGVTKDKCGISKGWGNSHGLGSLYGNFITVIHTAFQWSRCFYVCSADFFFFFFSPNAASCFECS